MTTTPAFADKRIDGKAYAERLRAQIAIDAANFAARAGMKAGLAVVLVGDDPASKVYVASKGKQTNEAGMQSFERILPGNATQAELLKLWDIKEEDAAPPAKTVKLAIGKPATAMTDAINAMAHSMRDAMVAAIDIATGTIATGNGKTPIKSRTAKKSPAKKSSARVKKKSATRPPPRKAAKRGSTAARRR